MVSHAGHVATTCHGDEYMAESSSEEVATMGIGMNHEGHEHTTCLYGHKRCIACPVECWADTRQRDAVGLIDEAQKFQLLGLTRVLDLTQSTLPRTS